MKTEKKERHKCLKLNFCLWKFDFWEPARVGREVPRLGPKQQALGLLRKKKKRKIKENHHRPRNIGLVWIFCLCVHRRQQAKIYSGTDHVVFWNSDFNSVQLQCLNVMFY